MQYRRDRYGNELSVLGFGCMRFTRDGARIDMKKAEKLILEAYEGGINYYDTAYIYLGSEEAIGEIFEKHGLREKIYIATKLPQGMCGRTSDFDRFFDIQRKRLRTDYIDYYLMHTFNSFKQWEKLLEIGIEDWLAAKKASGEIRQVGFSFHGSQGDFFKLVDAYDWDFVQIQYNYVNVKFQAGEAGLKYAAEKGIPVIIMEPLLGGKLASGLPDDAVKILREKKPDSTPVSWALRWLWNQPEVTLLLSGMNETSQLRENLKLADESKINMHDEDDERAIQKVVKIFNKNNKIPCTGCNYCMPCHVGINIPGLFSVYNTSFSVGRMTGIFQYSTATGAIGNDPHYAVDCTKCGKCEINCPQGIEIRKELKRVKRRLHIPGLKAVAPIIRNTRR